MSDKLKIGQYVIYDHNDGTVEIGMVKRVQGDSAFVYYSEGGTAAKTSISDLKTIKNSYVIDSTYLGRGDN